jgi:hypothetical protein
MARAFVLLVLLAGCSGPGHVSFDNGRCLIDGAPATEAEVEARQSSVSSRILERQPYFVLITMLVVALASLNYVGKLVVLFSNKKTDGDGLREKLRVWIDRHRLKPVRYFAVLITTLALLLAACGAYIYLDADKRASERALGMLQFCHLALRTADEQGVLAEQRHNLEAIQSTAGDIRSLVDKLPPEEQRKAQQIVDQMNGALAKQGRLVSEYLNRTEESTKAVREHTQAVERGLSTVEAGVLGLKSLPAGLSNVADQLHKVDGHVTTVDGKLAALDGRIAALDGALKALAARPQPACPACICDKATAAPRQERPDGGIHLAPVASTPHN